MTTEQRYRQATQYFTETGMIHGLKRQWEFIKEPDQKHFLIGSVLLTISVVSLCTQQGLKIGREIAERFHLNNEKKQAVILCGGGVGFGAGVVISVSGNAYSIEHSERMAQWKRLKINSVVEKLMLEEFESDPVWAQFICPISQQSTFVPTRTPTASLCDYNSLMEYADKNGGMIKDIFNKRVHLPTDVDQNQTHPISFSVDACIKDSETMMVIYKRFRHLATQKSKEDGLSQPIKEFFISYRNALGNLVKDLYLEQQEKINKKRASVQTKNDVTEEESEQAELKFNREIAIFKELFGDTPLSNINWKVERDWSTILNQRWIAEYHS